VGILGVSQAKLPTFKLEFPWESEGQILWYGLTATGFQMEGRTHTLIAFNDITRSIETSAELRRNQNLFRILSDHIQDLVAIVDVKGKRLYESPSYTRSLGWTREELNEMPPLALVHPEDLNDITQALESIFTRGQGVMVEYRMRTKSGEYRYFESQSAAVIGPDGVSEGALFSARDVSDRKEAERDRDLLQGQLLNAQKLESIGQLAAGIAHEINTPIQYIGDNTRFLADSFKQLVQIIAKQRAVFADMNLENLHEDLLREIPKLLLDQDFEYLSAEIPKAAEETLEGVERVAKIIKALKEFSYPMGEDPVVMDINKGIESTMIVAKNEWKYLADVEMDLDPELPLVPGFPGEFNQVVLNMTVNAVHAIQDVLVERGMDKGLLKVKTRKGDDGVLVSFQDNGKGIPEGIRSKVFDPFFTTKGVGRGTGQGLSIAHAVMEKHQGRISFESTVGVGTTFTLWLPLARKEIPNKEAYD
jgi:PAS domain S-box-containing protein